LGALVDRRDTNLEQQQTEKLENVVRDVDRIRITKGTHAVKGSLLGGHKSTPVRHKACVSPHVTEDLLGRAAAAVFTFDNWFSSSGRLAGQALR
jgi:hypothetical protein